MCCVIGTICAVLKKCKTPMEECYICKIYNFTGCNTPPWVFYTSLKCTNCTNRAAHHILFLKVGLSPSKNSFIRFKDSPAKMMKNGYFILKALFVLKIIKFLSWLFGHVEKTA